MAPGRCPACGGPNPAGALTCQWCQNQLPTAPSPSAPPLLSGYRPVELPRPPPSPEASPGVIIGVVITIVVLLVLVAAIASLSSAPPSPFPGPSPPFPSPGGTPTGIDVTQVAVVSPDNACGLNGADQPGFSDPSYYQQPLFWVLPMGNSTTLPCVVSSANTSTPGFQVLTGNLPQNVTFAGTSFSVIIQSPTNFSGILELTFA